MMLLDARPTLPCIRLRLAWAVLLPIDFYLTDMERCSLAARRPRA